MDKQSQEDLAKLGVDLEGTDLVDKLASVGDTDDKEFTKENDEEIDSHLKDYDSLMNYAMELLEDNKKLMKENLNQKIESSKMLELNLTLVQENEDLKVGNKKLIKDSMTLMEYNDKLQQARNTLESDVASVRKQFQALILNMDQKIAAE